MAPGLAQRSGERAALSADLVSHFESRSGRVMTFEDVLARARDNPVLLFAFAVLIGALVLFRAQRRAAARSHHAHSAVTADYTSDLRPWSQIGIALSQLRGVLLGGSLVAGLLLVGAAVYPDAVARALLGLSGSVILTGLGIIASYHASTLTARDQLLLYGMQACRQLEALHTNMRRRHEGGSPISAETVGDWCDHVRAAKDAWVQQVNAISAAQQSAQRRVDEIDKSFAEQIGTATTAQRRSELRSKRAIAVEALESQVPFPLRKPTDFDCPYCGARGTGRFVDSPGELEEVSCDACHRRVVLGRSDSGEVTSRVARLAFVDSRTLLPGLKAVAQVFADAPEHTMGDFGEYRRALEKVLRENGVPTSVQERMYELLYKRLHAFKLLGKGNGMRLAVEPDSLVPFVESRLAERVSPRLDAKRLCRQLYGSDTERLAALEQMVGPTASRA